MRRRSLSIRLAPRAAALYRNPRPQAASHHHPPGPEPRRPRRPQSPLAEQTAAAGQAVAVPGESSEVPGQMLGPVRAGNPRPQPPAGDSGTGGARPEEQPEEKGVPAPRAIQTGNGFKIFPLGPDGFVRMIES